MATTTSMPTSTPSSTPEGNSTSSGVIGQILNDIPLPHWAVYTIVGVGGFLLLVFICCCVHCYCRRKSDKKRRKQLDANALNKKSSGNQGGSGGDSRYGSTPKARGKLLYSLEYVAAKTELTVGIKQAAELLAMDLGGMSDPYVKVYICPNKTMTVETKVYRNTLNPVFNQVFSFQVKKSVLAKSEVVMQVFDFNRFTKHRIIGELRVDLSAMDWNHVIEEWQSLSEPLKGEPEDLGEVCISLRYVPARGRLTVIILEARNLRSMDAGGTSDPYVKIQLALDKRKWKKKKTSVKRITLDPYYNESFTFDVPFEYIKRLNLVISVWDHDTVTRNDPMGKIFLGSDASGNQLLHWADMLSNPRRPVSQWHTLLTAQQVNSTLALKKKKIIPTYH